MSRPAWTPRARAAELAGAVALALGCASGCGGAGRASTTATKVATAGQRVCTAAGHAAGVRLRAAARVHVLSSDPGYQECRVSAGVVVLDVVAQGVPQARSYYDTEIAHLVQTYAEPGGTRDRTQLPHDLAGLGSEAAWVPGQRRLLATNATVSRGGSVVEVTASGGSPPEMLAAARAAAKAALATAPRGPDPGPPPG